MVLLPIVYTSAPTALMPLSMSRKLPAIVASHLDLRYLSSIRSGTVGGGQFGGFVSGGMNAVPAAGGATMIIR